MRSLEIKQDIRFLFFIHLKKMSRLTLENEKKAYVLELLDYIYIYTF